MHLPTDIVAFSKEELLILDDYFKGTNAETAYLLGRYCGLRINEAFGLQWDHVDLEAGTILIDRQMQYQEILAYPIPLWEVDLSYYVAGENQARFVAGYMLDENGNVLAERDSITRIFK